MSVSETVVDPWTQLPRYLHYLVEGNSGSVLLQTSRFDALNRYSYLFLHPVEVLSVRRLDQIPELFRRIEEATAGGFHVAGFVSYEAGYHFERFTGVDLPEPDLPLAWFGVYASPFVYNHAEARFAGASPPQPETTSEAENPAAFTESATLVISRNDYCAKIAKIQQYIQSGDTYQVNFTDSVSARSSSSPATAFAGLSQSQPVAYSAMMNVAGHHILSLSPELFFRIEGDRIVTRPMKGTMPRGLDSAEDALQAIKLQNDEKNRSEHVMIVDLLRNDLGRICTMGSIQVDDIFSVEKYQTLLQMTSTISGTLRPALGYYDIFKSMFPSGSITGAPKIRTMQIIREMEDKPRGIYTGAIGFIAPNRTSVFNVAIRTVVLKDGIARMGVGGGIVADSKPDEEYRECLLKAGFLTRPLLDFQLIETMLWEDGSISFLPLHLDRLKSSASYFNFSLDKSLVLRRISEATQRLQGKDRYRVRLLLHRSGEAVVTATRLAKQTGTPLVRLASETTNSGDLFLRHKTTHRDLYEREFADARAKGFDDVLFTNERGEITEGAISNVFIRRAGELLTPPVASGVLPGIYRRHLLETDPTAREQVLTMKDLLSAETLFLCNSIRGFREATLLAPVEATHL